MSNICIEKCLKDIEQMMRKNANKKANGKIYYEFRINTQIFEKLKIPLLELYQKGFEQGVYVSK
jgi:hypothetical protein